MRQNFSVLQVASATLMLLLAACRHAPPAAAVANADPIFTLVISRHSIRSPILHKPPLSDYTTRAAGWPAWPPPADKPGYLTNRGKERATQLGRFYRQRAAAQGIFPEAPACPAANATFFYADLDERTKETSDGFIEGFFSGAPDRCGATTHIDVTPVVSPWDEKSVDPLFHPQAANVCALDTAAAQSEILAAIGGAPESLTAQAADDLATLQRVTQCCQPIACGQDAKTCALVDIPAGLKVDASKNTVTLTGPVPLGAYLSETLQLAYAEGMPDKDVGWAALSAADLLAIMKLHTLNYRVTGRTKAIATAGASNLLQRIVATLEQGATGREVLGALAPPQSRFVSVVGHDTNLVNLAGLLQFDWSLPGYQPGDPPPAGALIFELLGDKSVRLTFLSQSLLQMRDDLELTFSKPPETQVLSLPGCGRDCSFAAFQSLALAAIDSRCVSR